MKKIKYSLLGILLLAGSLVLFINKKEDKSAAGIIDYDLPKKADKPELYLSLLDELTIRPGEESYPMGYRFRELEKAQRGLSSMRIEREYNFTERGPANVPGRTRGLIVDPDDPDHKTWYAGGVGGGIWKTTNAGQSWQDLTMDIPNLSISWIVMAESNHDILYAGTGEGWGASSNFIKGNGILKSVDRGTTWTPLSSTLDNFSGYEYRQTL